MQEEFDALKLQGTWTLVPLPSSHLAIGCKWVFRIKRHSDGSIARYKARLVAKGYLQQAGIDFHETFSPVAKQPTIHIFICIALHNNWSITQLDISNAFLHGSLEEEVFMTQPPGFVDPSYPTHGFHNSLSDTSLFVKQTPTSLTLLVVSSVSHSDALPFAQPVNQACQHMHAPTNAHFQHVKRLLRYVKGTVSHGLSFTPGPLTLHAFSDSNWAGDTLDRRSTSGYCIFLGPNLISWSAKKQPTVSRSSIEAEYRSLANTAAEVSWLQQLLKDFLVPPSSIPVLWCDNLSAMALASNPVFHSRSKHIEIDCHFIRERVVSKQILLKYVPTSDQLADLVTTPLSGSHFHYLKDKLMLLPSPISLRGADKIQEAEEDSKNLCDKIGNGSTHKMDITKYFQGS
ncbi:hypothetical protein CsSME_00019460 [Camellia sinensis var. sinensis]